MKEPTTELRSQFCAWLRHRRHDLLATDDVTLRASLLTVLGLDDASLRAFRDARDVVVTLPHASPNVFFPRVYNGWYARHLQARDPSVFHLRVVLTHTNFSDLNWRPYAWWYVDAAGRLGRLTLFTRNKKRKHVVVASQGPVTDEVPHAARAADREALEGARHAANRASSYLLMSARTERHAGLAVDGRTMYLPLDLLIAFAAGCRGTLDGPERRWLDALFHGATGRRVAPGGELRDAAGEAPFILDNSSNLSMLSLLGRVSVVGGAVMGGYWDEVTARVTAVNRRAGVALPAPGLLRRPAANDGAPAVLPSPGLAESLKDCGIGYSQGMAVAEHGAFARTTDPFA